MVRNPQPKLEKERRDPDDTGHGTAGLYRRTLGDGAYDRLLEDLNRLVSIRPGRFRRRG